jgi:hypothetical protein
VVAQVRPAPGRALQTSEDFTISIRFDDGSLGALLYGTTGAAGGKEIIEAHRGSRSGRIDDFRVASLRGKRRARQRRSRGQDKGHSEEIRRFAAVMRGEIEAVTVEAALASTRLTFAALRSVESGMEERVECSVR